MPTLSILIPTSGRPDQLQHCLGTLVEVAPPSDGFEVIVVDDGTLFHRQSPAMMKEPLEQIPLKRRAVSVALLGVWQVANASGFFSERFASPD